MDPTVDILEEMDKDVLAKSSRTQLQPTEECRAVLGTRDTVYVWLCNRIARKPSNLADQT